MPGYLTKRSAWLKDWRKRYFVLKGGRLYFSKSPSQKPHGVIDLQECLTVKSAEEKCRKANSFEVATPDVTYFMYADTPKEKDEWIGAIGRAIVRNSTAFVDEDGYESD